MTAHRTIKVSVFMATSLDGFIAREDGDVEWLHEGDPLPEGDDAGYSAFYSTIDVLVLGRGSFEKVLTFSPFPYGDTPVVVMSSTLTEVPEALSKTVRIENLSPEDLLKKLEAEGFQHVYLDGGKLIQSFLQAGLVDEMTLTTIPILIGKGRPLFGTLDRDIRLQHITTKTWSNGMVQTTYKIEDDS